MAEKGYENNKDLVWKMFLKSCFRFQNNNLAETGHKKRFTYSVAKRGHENITVKIFFFIASAKFQSAMESVLHRALVGNYEAS